ncbi:MAG: thymidine phosphorylase [candidate division KSB1 bacterium]|nr:thymidine phosphorylase [candidate division KSB1 bacterium]
MDIQEIITQKQNGKALSSEQIEYFIQEYAQNKIPDYQAAAWLTAVYLKGMNPQETSDLTRAMLHSGGHMDFRKVSGPKIDKHSTGGVGDKISLILAPLAAAAGIRVPMISGRGLGHSGGTLDKLESIPGLQTNLSIDEFYRLVEEIGVAMIGQTPKIVPADRKLYALRDATSTVESIPLITASILSKKLAEDLDGLVLDIKVGRGAFMKNTKQAKKLADLLIKTAAENDLATTALLTRMDQPLGYMTGNWLEILEVIDCLKGEGPQDIMQVTRELALHMLLMGRIVTDSQQGYELLTELIESGKALDKFKQMIHAQNGALDVIEHPSSYPQAEHIESIKAEKDGYISDIDDEKLVRPWLSWAADAVQ